MNIMIVAGKGHFNNIGAFAQCLGHDPLVFVAKDAAGGINDDPPRDNEIKGS
jgi:hypothetical protein